MNKIIIYYTKTLRLTNVLLYSFEMEDFGNINENIQKIQSYIKNKGAQQVGPLIQNLIPKKEDNNKIKIFVNILLQTNTFINHTEPPYKMESIIRIPNCMYCRYTGPEEKLKFAYDKILLTAFEEDIPLKGDSYTIFVDRQDDNIIADVFMERADNE